MAFEDLKESTEGIREQAQAIIESNVAYYRLRAFKMAMKSTTMVLKLALIAMCVLMVLLFLSVALAFYIGSYMSNYALGFLCVGGLYVLVTIVLVIVRDKIIEGPLLNKFSKLFFNN
jgi:hypothetical protein